MSSLPFSGVLLPLCLAVLLLVAYRPLFSSPASEWHALHGDAPALQHPCVVREGLSSLDCVGWMFDGRAAAQFGAFEPVTLLWRAMLVSINGAPMGQLQSWHFCTLIVHLATGVLLMFTTERLLALLLNEPVVNGEDDGASKSQRAASAARSRRARLAYRAPSCFASAWWLLNPQRVEAVAWFSGGEAVVLASFWSLSCLWLLLRAASSASASQKTLLRFLAWVSYVAACWSHAAALPLVGVIILIDAFVLLPRERRIATLLAAKSAPAAAAGAASATVKDNFLIDLLHSCARNGVFLAAWCLCFYLSTTAALQSLLVAAAPSRAGLVSISSLWSAYLRALVDPSTLMARAARSMLSLAWYARQVVHPTDLHIFTTRLVPLQDEGSAERLLLGSGTQQGELIDLLTVASVFIIVVAFLLARKHRSLALGIAGWMVMLLPHTALFTAVTLNVRPGGAATKDGDLITLEPAAPHVWVADRWAYLAAALLAPAIARAVLRSEDLPTAATASLTPTASATSASASSSAPAAAVAPAPSSKAAKIAAAKQAIAKAATGTAPAVAATAATSAAAAPTALVGPKPASFDYMLPRVLLFLLVASTGLFVLHATPSTLSPAYCSVSANCAAVLALDGSVVECHEALGLAAYKAGPEAWPQALRFLDLARLAQLKSKSIVALTVRARILAEGVLPAKELNESSQAHAAEEDDDAAAQPKTGQKQQQQSKPSPSQISDAVRATFEQALSLLPPGGGGSAFVLQEWASIAFDKLHDPSLAAQLLERCVNSNPTFLPCYSALSAVSRARGDLELAESYAAQARQIQMNQQHLADTGRHMDASSVEGLTKVM